jgi:hypothetical protein
MIIDESLARGLARQLISNWIERSEALFDQAIKLVKNSDVRSKKGNLKYLSEHKKLFKPLSFTYVESGSEKHPINGYIIATPFKDRSYKEWTEKGVRGIIDFEFEDHNLGSHFQNQLDGLRYSTFYIGEHVITRIIQRSYTQESINQISPENLVKKFRFIPLWSAFWSSLFSYSNVKNQFPEHEIESLSLPIPAEEGLFLCKLTTLGDNKVARIIDVRTYINLDKLTTDQKLLHKCLLQMSDHVDNSSICFWPYNCTINEEFRAESLLLFKILVSRLTKDLDQICDQLTSGSDFDSYKVSKVIQSITNSLDFSNELFPIFEKLVNEKTPREYHSILKKLMFQQYMTNNDS